MGIFVTGVGANSFLFSFNGVDLTNHVQTVKINQAYDQIDITAMGAVSKAYVPGLRDDSVDVTFFNDLGTCSGSDRAGDPAPTPNPLPDNYTYLHFGNETGAIPAAAKWAAVTLFGSANQKFDFTA